MSKRLCIVNNQLGYFHCWENYANVSSPSLMVGGAPGGQISRVYGIVEFPDGVQRADPKAIQFIDEDNLFLLNLTIKENPVKIVMFLTDPNEKYIFINSLRKSIKGKAKKINYISSENHDISEISIDGICNLYFYSDEEAVRGLTPDYVFSKSYDVANYLHNRGAAILLSFSDVMMNIIKKLEVKND